jgi:intracellular sulfur oxidation DsrE/DsrF family protein
VRLLQKSATPRAARPGAALGSAVGSVADNSGDASNSDTAAFSDRDLMSQIREMKAMGVRLFACSAALADAGLSVSDLISEVDGVRGAAALLAAGLADDTRLLSF